MANVWKILTELPRLTNDVKALAGDITKFHTDPKIVAAVAGNPDLKALSDDISQKARDIQEAFK